MHDDLDDFPLLAARELRNLREDLAGSPEGPFDPFHVPEVPISNRPLFLTPRPGLIIGESRAASRTPPLYAPSGQHWITSIVAIAPRKPPVSAYDERTPTHNPMKVGGKVLMEVLRSGERGSPDPRRNTSKTFFEAWASGDKVDTCLRFVSTLCSCHRGSGDTEDTKRIQSGYTSPLRNPSIFMEDGGYGSRENVGKTISLIPLGRVVPLLGDCKLFGNPT